MNATVLGIWMCPDTLYAWLAFEGLFLPFDLGSMRR